MGKIGLGQTTEDRRNLLSKTLKQQNLVPRGRVWAAL